jgi:hypothetical protein
MNERFEKLLTRLPDIAKAVNAFDGEALRIRALDALLAECDTQVAAARPARSEEEDVEVERNGTGKGSDDAKAKKPRKAKDSSKVPFDSTLDLFPSAKQSFQDFAVEKAPSNQLERLAVSVFYVSEILGLAPVTAAHIFTCFEACSWPLPADWRNALSKAKTLKFLAFDSFDDVSLPATARNRVKLGK